MVPWCCGHWRRSEVDTDRRPGSRMTAWSNFLDAQQSAPDPGTFQQSYGQHLAVPPSDPASQQLVGLPAGERGRKPQSARRLSSPW
jgi:hypothetical protein